MRAAVVLVGVLALASLALAADDPTAKLEGVTDLTPANFDDIHNGRKAALIEFYAPWCGHCKHLSPVYAKLGAAIAKDPKLRNRVLIAKVDADAHRSLGEKFGVRGFPTLKWFPRGKPADPEDYNRGRSLDDFLKFINEKVAADAGFARVDALVPLAAKFHAAAEGERAAVLAEAEKVAAGVAAEEKENAKLYLHFMRKAVQKGGDYIKNELERLQKMAEKAMSAAKADEVARKVSVLQSFVEAPAEEKKEEKKEAEKKEEHAEGDEYEVDDEEEGGEAHAEAEEDDGMVYADGLDDEPEAGAGDGAAAEDAEDDPYADEL